MQEEAEQIVDVSRVCTDDIGPHLLGKDSGKAPKMPYFNEKRDFMDSYFGRFGRFATCQRWNRVDWALYLLALLKDCVLNVYFMLPADEVNNYD